MSRLSSIWIGWEPREAQAFMVARWTAQRRMTSPCIIRGLVLDDLVERGLYRRPMRTDKPGYYDLISAAPMATQFAISRFFVPMLTAELRGNGKKGWAMFMDCDMVNTADIAELWAMRDDAFSVMCVKHDYQPTDEVKFLGNVQTRYEKKNWSSVMLFNNARCRALTPDVVAKESGLYLHQFKWLEGDHLIGGLPVTWNYLVGEMTMPGVPKLIHYTLGGPYFESYRDCEHADVWRRAREQMLTAAKG